MVTQELLSYIQTSLAGGKTKEQIERELVSSGGWTQADVTEAFSALHIIPQIKPGIPTPKKSGSFVLTLLIVLIILGGIAFGAEKFYGPSLKTKIAGIIGIAIPGKTTGPQDTSNQQDAFTNVQPPNNSIVTLPQNQTPQTSTPAVAPETITTDQNANIPTTTCADNDLNCMISAAATCTVASVKDTMTVNLFGINTTGTGLYSIIGKQTGGCEIDIKSLNITVVPPNGTTLPSDIQAFYDKLQGSEAACVFAKTSDLITVLKNWQKGIYSSSDFAKAKCSGSYFSPAAQ